MGIGDGGEFLNPEKFAGVPNWVKTLIYALHYAARTLWKNRGVTVVAIVTLALGIGANTAIFSILDPLLLQKLPVEHPDELVHLDTAGSLTLAEVWYASAFNLLSEKSPAFSGMLGFKSMSLDDVSVAGRPRSLQAELVSPNYFELLGLRPLAGRLSPEVNAIGNVVVLGFEFWRREFAADPAALGKTIVVQDKPLTIIGITPTEFFGMRVGEVPDIYLPLSPGVPAGFANGLTLDWAVTIGRLRPGVTLDRALSMTQPIFEQIRKDSPIPVVEQRQVMDHLVFTSAAQGLSSLRTRFSLPARTLMALTGLMLLIACFNVANLLLAQGTARKREIAVRLALGAPRRQLVREFMTESALLAIAGTTAGLLMTQWTSRLIVASMSDAHNRVVLSTPIGGRVLLFSLVSAILTLVLAGLVPALSMTHVDISHELKLNAVGKRGSRLRLSNALVVGQIAMSVTALVAGGMFLHSLMNLETMDLGFDRDHILSVDISGDAKGYSSEQVQSFYDRLLERTRALSGVRSVAFSSFAPVSGRMFGINLRVAGYARQAGEESHAFFTSVTPGYFSTLGIQLLQGRDFTSRDLPTSPRAAIINRSLAQHYFAGQNPIGKHVDFVEGNRSLEIVGVVADSKYNDLREEVTDFVYIDSLQSVPKLVASTLSVRAATTAESLKKELPELIRSLDPSIRTTRVATLQERVDDSLHTERMVSALCGMFSLLALLLAAVGLYGMLAFNVSRRTGEIGIRMALGAKRADILTLVVGSGMKLVLWGLLLGSIAALALTGLIESMLFGVKRGDPLTFIAIGLLLAFAGALACYIPARRATRVDPLVALRTE